MKPIIQRKGISSMIYYMLATSTDPQLVKIGSSVSPELRSDEIIFKILRGTYTGPRDWLTKANRALIKILAAHPGSVRLEKKLHKHFEDLRTTYCDMTEWFHFRASLITHLEIVNLAWEEGKEKEFIGKYERIAKYKGESLAFIDMYLTDEEERKTLGEQTEEKLKELIEEKERQERQKEEEASTSKNDDETRARANAAYEALLERRRQAKGVAK